MNPLISSENPAIVHRSRALTAALVDSRSKPVVLKKLAGKKHLPKEAVSVTEQVERIRESNADYRTLPTQEESLFLRQGDYWTIWYQGRVALLKSMRGLRYLAVLLGAPGHEFHVRELARVIDASTVPSAFAVHARVTGTLYAGVPRLDARAKAECKSRLNELRQDLKEAERFNDPQRQINVRNEIQVITNYVASAVGLRGRDRKTFSHTERARSAVTKCIKKAIQKIGDAIPSLGYHLAARVKTGYFCSYKPHPERPVSWKV